MNADGKEALAKLDPKDRREIWEIGKHLVQYLYESWIARGELDPAGKTPETLAAEFFRMLIPLVRNRKRKPTFRLIVAHGESLLLEARRFNRLDKLEMSLLFYATWFEHWINGLLDRKAAELKLTDRALKLALRQTGLEAKLVCFPVLAKLPPLREQHIKAILRCADFRNSFVHYKFSVHSRDSERDDEPLQKTAIVAAEKAVRYLIRYDQRHVFKGAKHRVRKILFQE